MAWRTEDDPGSHIGKDCDNVGGADYHMEYSGTCDVVGADDKETIAKTRELLSYLPSNFREKPPVVAPRDEVDREVPALMRDCSGRIRHFL